MTSDGGGGEMAYLEHLVFDFHGGGEWPIKSWLCRISKSLLLPEVSCGLIFHLANFLTRCLARLNALVCVLTKTSILDSHMWFCLCIPAGQRVSFVKSTIIYCLQTCKNDIMCSIFFFFLFSQVFCLLSPFLSLSPFPPMNEVKSLSVNIA